MRALLFLTRNDADVIALVLGLLAAAFYGGADFCGGLATRRTAVLAVTVISQGAGLVLVLCVLPFFSVHMQLHGLLSGALGGLCAGIGIALLYRALAIGRMGIVSPITAVIGAAVPVVYASLRGDHLSAAKLVGIGIALLAVVLVSSSNHDAPAIVNASLAPRNRGLKEALASGVLLGGFYIFLGNSSPTMGFEPLLAARVVSVLVLLAIAGITRTSVRPQVAALPLILLCGAMDVSANALYLFATYHGQLAIAAVLTSLYPASTVLLAYLILKERLQPLQQAGVALALVGVVLIAV